MSISKTHCGIAEAFEQIEVRVIRDKTFNSEPPFTLGIIFNIIHAMNSNEMSSRIMLRARGKSLGTELFVLFAAASKIVAAKSGRC